LQWTEYSNNPLKLQVRFRIFQAEFRHRPIFEQKWNKGEIRIKQKQQRNQKACCCYAVRTRLEPAWRRAIRAIYDPSVLPSVGQLPYDRGAKSNFFSVLLAKY